MGRKTKRKKLLKTTMKALRARGEPSPEGRQTMNSEPFHPEPFHPEPAADPQDGAAVIHEVTPEMMDEAAHRAAALADGVAHHAIPHDVPRADEPAAVAREVGETVEAATDHAATQVVAVAAAAVDATADRLAGMTEVAQESAAEVRDVMVRTAEAAGTGLPGGIDAFGQYNAKLFEMVRNNMASTTALFAALVQAKSVPEAVALNADHLRRQMDTLTTQGRDLATLAQKLALDALQPLKAR